MKRLLFTLVLLSGLGLGSALAQRSMGIIQWNLPPDFVESIVLVGEGKYRPEGLVDFRALAKEDFSKAGEVPGAPGLKVVYQGSGEKVIVRNLVDGESYTVWVWCRKGEGEWIHSKGKLKPKNGSGAVRISISYIP